MREQGEVTSLDGKFAVVKVDKRDECSKCGMCLFPKNASSVDFRAKNGVFAKVGDKVVIETQKDGKLLGAILAFLVPLILIGLAAVITYIFIRIEIWMLILSVIFVVLWYTILAIIDKKLKNSLGFCPIIVSVINKEENKDE